MNNYKISTKQQKRGANISLFAILFALFTFMPLSVFADDYEYLTFTDNTGAESSLVALGTTITFDNGNLVATNGTQQVTVALTDLLKISFSATPNAIADVKAESNSEVDVYSVSGLYIGHFADKKDAPLRRGVYIVKEQSGHTTKNLVK